MKLKVILVIASLGASSATYAEDKIIGDGTLPSFLQHFDTNEDGTIDVEERQAIHDYRQNLREQRRTSIDSDGDGELSDTEIQSIRDEIRAQIEKRRNEQFSQISGEDNLINTAEFLTIPGLSRLPEFIQEALFNRLDLDGSGGISSTEFLFRLRRHGNSNSNSNSNSNGNGNGNGNNKK